MTSRIDPFSRSREAIHMRLHHLRGRKTADLVMRRGRVWKGKMMIVRWLPGVPKAEAQRRRQEGKPPASGMFLGTFASLKLSKKAVLRNRMRRRCREAFRVIVREREHVPTVQLLICPRSASLKAPFTLIKEDVKAFLATLH